MEDFLGSLFCVYIVYLCCRNSSTCSYSYINRKFHITLHHKLLEHILLPNSLHSSKERYIQAQHKMGVIGIIAYVTLVPAAIYIWIKDGRFFFLDIHIGPIWYHLLFWSQLIVYLLDYWIDYFFAWCKERK